MDIAEQCADLSLLTEYNNYRRQKYFRTVAALLVVLITPSVLFNLLIHKKHCTIQGTNIVVVQPNMIRMKKITVGTTEAQLQKLIVTTKGMDEYLGWYMARNSFIC